MKHWKNTDRISCQHWEHCRISHAGGENAISTALRLKKRVHCLKEKGLFLSYERKTAHGENGMNQSETRIKTIAAVIQKFVGRESTEIIELIKSTGTGQAICNHNQVVLHDQVTSNAEEILSELSEKMPINAWTDQDIAEEYNHYLDLKVIEEQKIDIRKFSKADGEQKVRARNERKKLRDRMKAEMIRKEQDRKLARKVDSL